MLGGNKRRVYIAFFHREASPENPLRFHTALLVTPKNPNSASDKKSSRLFHVVNRIDNTTKQDTWYFEPRETRSRTQMLAGLMLLGKVPNGISDQELENILEQVERKTLVSEDREWRCRHWVWEALAHLVSHNVIPSLPADPKEVWEAGISFMDNQPIAGPKETIPCCNTAGEPITSEIGAM